ncbi:protein kinase [Pseudenhygromyxa sp. WMMC2535]|uniref:serine/threonine-protein kinase n=1 Tax=Pseudenhygromyxa sp. WMMC2535 TaxID=2712867 RepID=UPI001555CE7A|nr:serine/threonine-protein kinase [Pseudenhygromyxa sp. WMMC2535]NVB40403.1 protein kinase [Pseudenhygromyxa sp. WMMC2535]
MSERQVAQPQWRPGRVIADKYEITEQIGAGGMGSVYAAKRRPLGDVVAIKSVLPQRSSARNRARFLREARALARVRHPNVVQVFDFGEAEDGRPYMVMEYVEGPTLARVLAAGRPPLARALEIFADVCKAVEAGHRRGVVHRDLKPGNVMLARSDDGGEIVKVLDFGLAAVLEDEPELRPEGPQRLVGTYGYMSPELIESGAFGPASDIFALGVMLYELATGVTPYRASNAVTTVVRICEGEREDPRALVPDLSADICAAIAAALAHDPAARPGSALALAAMALGTGSDRLTAQRTAVAGRGSGRGGSQGEAGWGPLTSSGASLSGAGESEGFHDEPTQARDEPTQDPEDDAERVRAALAMPPFVGRRLDLDALLDLLPVAQVGGEVPFALVLGEAGAGRTRLLRRFAEDARATGATVFEGRFYAHDGDRAPAAETFLRMLGAGTGQRDDEVEVGADRRSGFAELERRFADGAGGAGPVVLVLDDLHRAPSRDLEFLGYLLRGGHARAPVVLVAAARSEAARADAGTELSRWLLGLVGLRARTTLVLAPFDEDELRAWLEAVFGRLHIHPRDLRRLRRVSGGNPYDLSELIRHLVASERIHPAEDGAGGWVSERLGREVLPASLSSAVGDQLTSLEEPLLRVLEVAAVIAEQFRFEVLERAMGMGEGGALDDLVDEAVARGLLVEHPVAGGEVELALRSAKVQQVLYERIGTRKRRRLHRAVVEALVGLDAPERIAKILAGHYRAIADWPRTLAWGMHAAREALGRHDHDAAERALEHAQVAVEALERAGGDPLGVLGAAERARIDALAGTLDARVGRFAEGITRLRAASSALDRLARRGGEDESRLPGAAGPLQPLALVHFEAALSLARCHLGKGELDESARVGREALARAQTSAAALLGGEAARLEAEWEARVALGHTLARFGDWRGAAEVLGPVVEATPEPQLRVLHVLALRELGWVEARRGELGRAEAHAEQAAAEARACGEPLALYCAESVQAVVDSGRGREGEAIVHFRAALREARALSLRRREMIELANLSMVLAERDEQPAREEALRGMLGVISICRELGDVASAADARVGLGRVLRARGDLDEAAASFRRGHETCEAVGRHEYAAIALFELGRCELARGDWEAARAASTQAREGLARLGSQHLWEVELDIGRAARALGDEAEAQRRAAAAAAVLEARRSEASAGDLEGLERALAEVRAFADAGADADAAPGA